MTPFRLLHLSDFHFGFGIETHDDRLLRALEESLQQIDSYDRIIVSGDLTERGDPLSLERARYWLLDEIGLGEGPPSGLHLGDFSKLRVIPGNHDAFDAPSSLKLNVWQESVQKFYAQFDGDTELSRENLSYEWLERDGAALFIVYINTCYLGGAQTTTRFPGFLARTARGNMSVEQTEALLALHDKASRGELTITNDAPISATAYRDALKIVVMHHFVVPPKMKVRWLTKLNMWTCLKLNQRRRVFANLVLADVSMILCGHSHLGELQEMGVAENLDRRAHARYLLNRVRRHLGLTTEPVRAQARQWGRTLIALLHVLHSAADESLNLKTFNELIDQLLRGNTDLKKQLIDHLADDDELRREIDEDEIRLISQSVKALGKKRRKELRRLADEIIGSAAKFRNSRVLQAMNGSSAKKWSKPKRRTYFEYSITREDDGKWRVATTRYEYRDGKGFESSSETSFRPEATA